MKYLKPIIFIILIISVSCLLADYKGTYKQYKRGDYKSAYDGFSRLAELGNLKAIKMLGKMTKKGQGTNKDINRSIAFNLVVSEYYDTVIEREKYNPEIIEDFDELIKLYGAEKVATKYKPKFIDQNTDFTNFNKNDKELFVAITKKTAKVSYIREGFVSVAYSIDKNGKPYDINVLHSYPAKSKYIKSIKKSLSSWVFDKSIFEKEKEFFNRHIRTFQIVPSSRDEEVFSAIVREIERNASQEYSESQLTLALFPYVLSNYIKPEEKQDYLLKASQNGNARAQLLLGLCLIVGNTCKKDVDKGMAWLEVSSEGGEVEASKYIDYQRKIVREQLTSK